MKKLIFPNETHNNHGAVFVSGTHDVSLGGESPIWRLVVAKHLRQ